MDKEIWKDIKEFEGKYAVSNWGRVKSLNFNRTGKERLLSTVKYEKGYLFVNLYKNGKCTKYTVHRLVLSTFNPCPDSESLQVNHINELKDDNRLENLEWCDGSYNVNHGTRNLRDAEKKSIPIVQLSLDGKYIRSWKSSHDAEREGGFNNAHINSCCKGRYKTHKGYRFMYLSEFLDKNCGIID